MTCRQFQNRYLDVARQKTLSLRLQHRQHFKEFLLGRGGVVLGSIYASGPVGRMGADEAIRQITNRERRRQQQEQAAH